MPSSIASGDVSFAELGQLTRHLALEVKAKADELVVVAGVQFGDPADGAGKVALVDRECHDEAGVSAIGIQAT
jgi:hypothetical protein